MSKLKKLLKLRKVSLSQCYDKCACLCLWLEEVAVLLAAGDGMIKAKKLKMLELNDVWSLRLALDTP